MRDTGSRYPGSSRRCIKGHMPLPLTYADDPIEIVIEMYRFVVVYRLSP